MNWMFLASVWIAQSSMPGGGQPGLPPGSGEAQFGRIQGLEHPYYFMHYVDQPRIPPLGVYLFALVLGVLLATGLYFLQRHLQARLGAGLGKRFWLSISLVVVFFVLMELGLSVFVSFFPYQLFIPDPMGFWRTNPQLALATGRFPARGGMPMDRPLFLDNQCNPEKTAGTFRIVCLGDSQTMARPWVSAAQAYPKVLQGLLRESFPSREIEVVNGGISGYTSFQGLFAIKHIALGYQPDVLVISYCLHDGDISYAEDKEVMTDSAGEIALKRLLYRSQLYLMLRKIIFRQKALLFDSSKRPVVARVSLGDYEKNLREMVDLARARQIRCYFLDLPVDFGRVPAREPYRLVMRKVAQSEGVPLIDASGAATSLPTDQRGRFFFDGVHFTPLGNRIIARMLLQRMAPGLFGSQP